MVETSPQYMVARCQGAEHWCRAERLYIMKCMFTEGGSYTIGELAERFQVAENTIGRDLRTLSTRLGLPLICEVRWKLMDNAP